MTARFAGASLFVLALTLPTLASAQELTPETNAPAANPAASSSGQATIPSAPSADATTVVPGTSRAVSAGSGSGLDTLVPADGPAPVAAPAPTGNPILDRLNALEARVQTLEGENATLRSQAGEATTRIEKVEVRAAKSSATNGIVPTFSDITGATTFKVRGVIDADYAGFNERRGGYDYNNGTGFRRARIGFEGTAFKDFNWRIEADFAGNTVNLQDAYVQYAGVKPLLITLGQFKAPFGLESNNSDNYNTFMERGTFNVAASNLGAERKIGIAAAIIKDSFTATVGAFGENESIGRAANSALASATCDPALAVNTPNLCDTPDEGYGFNGRVTWEPIFDTGKILHLGAATYWRTDLRTATVVGTQLSDRPNIRVDNGNIIDSGVIAGAKDAWYYGAEASGVYGPFTLQGEYGHLRIYRTGLTDPTFNGFYVYGTWFLTGETRPFKAGNFDRVRPFNNLGKGGYGALELALRYDEADLSHTPVLARAGNKAHSWTAGLNWYWNPFIKMQFNYIRFAGTNTPLDPIGDKTRGDVFATRLHIDW